MLVVDQVLSTKHQECEFLERKKRNPLKCSRISYKDELVLVTPLWRCKSKIEPGCLAWEHTWSSGWQVGISVVGTALGAFIPCCRSPFSHPPGCRGWHFPLAGGSQDPAWHRAGIAKSVPREAQLSWAQLRAHTTSCQEMSMSSCLSALTLLKQGTFYSL